MKYCVDSVAKPAAPTMTEAEVFASTEAFAEVHEAMNSGEFSTSLEVYDNLCAVKDLIDSKSALLNKCIIQDPELLDMYKKAGSTEAFAQVITENIAAAEEGMLADTIWDNFISAFIHRKDILLEHLKPLVPALIKQVSEADPKKFGQWKVFRQINVFSKYLPDQNQFEKCYSSLKAAADYLSGISPDKFEQDKFNGFFSGSVYAKKNGKVSTSTIIGTSIIFQRDIRQRGWTEQKHFIDALNQMKTLLESMEKLGKTLAANKSKKFEGEAKSTVKAYSSAANNVLNLIGHLGRGITAASSKISGSIWKRLFTLES